MAMERAAQSVQKGFNNKIGTLRNVWYLRSQSKKKMMLLTSLSVWAAKVKDK